MSRMRTHTIMNRLLPLSRLLKLGIALYWTEVNQSRTVPEQPKVVCNLLIRMSWSMVSKAADRSSSDKIDT